MANNYGCLNGDGRYVFPLFSSNAFLNSDGCGAFELATDWDEQDNRLLKCYLKNKTFTENINILESFGLVSKSQNLPPARLIDVK